MRRTVSASVILIILTLSCCDLFQNPFGTPESEYQRINPVDSESSSFVGTSLLTPSETITEGKPLFSWGESSLSGAVYRFQLSENSDFSTPIIDEANLNATSHQAADFLPNETTLYGRVSVSNPDYTDVWSRAVTFTTAYTLGIRSISIGMDLTMVVKEDDSLWIAGDNTYGYYGDGTTDTGDYPFKLMGNVRQAEIYSPAEEDKQVLFALKTDGTLLGWGKNDLGQLGDGTTEDRGTPVQVMTDVDFFGSCGKHSLAVKTDGSLWAWGNNSNGQIGDGTFVNRLSPFQVTGVPNITEVGCYINCSMAVDDAGKLYVWGAVYDGNQYPSPELYSSSIHFVEIEASYLGNCYFIDDQKLLYGIGNSIGDNTSFDRQNPTEIMTDVVMISQKHGHYASITSDKTLYKWGEGVLAPTEFLHDVVLVENGVHFDMAVKTDGTIWAWGYGSATAAGDPAVNISSTPTQVTTW